MRESSWNDCLESESAINISPDISRVKSLKETSEERIKLIKKINKENSNFVFEDYYISILELLQALVIKRGYRINNHICLGYHLRDLLKREELYQIFDDLRYKRNSLTYYGKKMDFEVSLEAIEKSRRLIKELNIIFDKNGRNKII